MSKIKSTLSKSLPAIIVSVMFTTAIIYAAWQEPTQEPPGGNVPAPINVGPLPQSFLGSKTLNVRNGAIPNGGVLSINGGLGVSGVFQASGGSGRTVLSVAGNNVGIGANATNTVKLLIQDNISQGGILRLQNTRSQANDTWWIGFTHGFDSSDANDRARIGVNIHPAGPGRLVFYTGSAGNQIERMRIDDKGNVGIGIINPLNKLDVAGSVAIGSYAGVNTTTSGLIVSGSVGIGTPNPTQKLDVAGRIKTDDIALKTLGTSSNVWVGDVLKSIRVGPPGCKGILTLSNYCWTDQKTVAASSCSATSPAYDVKFMKCDGTIASSPSVPRLCATASLIDGSFPLDAPDCSKRPEGCLPECGTTTISGIDDACIPPYRTEFGPARYPFPMCP
jgi:hypothetical protein